MSNNFTTSASVNETENQNSVAPKKSKKILTIVLSVVAVAVIAVICVSVFSTDYVSVVKDGALNAYPDVTVGETFEKFFAEPSWETFEAESGERIVEFKGVCEYYGEDADCTIQFEIEDDDETFEIYTIELDGEPLSEIEIAAMIEVIYSE